MANTYFEFKKFKIIQEKSPMKVGTDGVLIGCWADAPEVLPIRILDIGSGTGLISLILCQRFDGAEVTGVEIHELAAKESMLNIANSPWANNVSIHIGSLESFTESQIHHFDLIVSNPPFYQTNNKSGIAGRDTARHADALPLTILLQRASALLSAEGSFCFIYPAEFLPEIITICNENSLFVNRVCFVKPTPQKAYKRVMLSVSKTERQYEEESLIIEDRGRHKYSEKYKALTNDFYL